MTVQFEQVAPAKRFRLTTVLNSGTAKVTAMALGIKAILLVYGWLAYILVPQEERVTPPDPHLAIDWIRIWSQWDVGGYMRIAERGYIASDPATSSFFPLFPLLMRVGALVTGNVHLAGFIISNVAIVVAAVLLYRLTRLLLKDEATAFRASFYMLIFPSAFYTSTSYAEALYLLSAIGSFYLMERRRWLLSGIVGGLAAMTRITGIVIAPVLGLAYLISVWKRRQLDLGILVVPLALAGFAAVLYLYQQQTGDALAFVRGQEGWGRTSFGPLAALKQGWEMVNWQHMVKGYEENYTTNAINWGSAVLFLILGVAAIRTIGPIYGLYTLLAIIVPLSFTPLGDRPVASMARFALAAFPAFMVLGHWGRRPIVDRIITVVFVLFLGLLTGLFLRSWNVAGVS